MTDAIPLDTAPGDNLLLPADEWMPYRLPELATNGFPFSPPFIVKKVDRHQEKTPDSKDVPFGFVFRKGKDDLERRYIDLSKGYYDPQTQTYNTSFDIPGETEGGTFDSSQWTYDDSKREWDKLEDTETD